MAFIQYPLDSNLRNNMAELTPWGICARAITSIISCFWKTDTGFKMRQAQPFAASKVQSTKVAQINRIRDFWLF